MSSFTHLIFVIYIASSTRDTKINAYSWRDYTRTCGQTLVGLEVESRDKFGA